MNVFIFGVLMLVANPILQTAAHAQTPAKPKPATPKPAPVVQRTILDQALFDAAAARKDIAKECKLYRDPTAENAKKLEALEQRDHKAAFVIENEVMLRALYEAFDRGSSKVASPLEKAKAWQEHQTTEISPKANCTPANEGYFLCIKLQDLVGYFKALENYAKNFKGTYKQLIEALKLRVITDYGLTPTEGMAALAQWNETIRNSKMITLPFLSWDDQTKKLIKTYEDPVDLTVLNPDARFGLGGISLKPSDAKVLFTGTIRLSNNPKTRDEAIWEMIQVLQVTLDSKSVFDSLHAFEPEKLNPHLVASQNGAPNKTAAKKSTAQYASCTITEHSEFKHSYVYNADYIHVYNYIKGVKDLNTAKILVTYNTLNRDADFTEIYPDIDPLLDQYAELVNNGTCPLSKIKCSTAGSKVQDQNGESIFYRSTRSSDDASLYLLKLKIIGYCH